MDLLKIINESGIELYKQKYIPLRVHLEGYKEFADKFNIPISLTSNEAAATGLISRGYISIENLIVAYKTIGCILYLPKDLTDEQIDYVEEKLPYFRNLEKDNKLFNVGIYSEEPLYYNNKKYRNLLMESKTNGEGHIRELTTDLLVEELNRQKSKTLEHKK